MEKVNKLNESESKFIQIYINNEPYLRYAYKKGVYHSKILESTLIEFGIHLKTRPNENGREIPLEEDAGLNYNYKMVGAGEARYVSENTVEFYHFSSDYSSNGFMNTSLDHLKDVFRDKKVKISKASGNIVTPSYFVEFYGD
jgi:hypothetical protein